MIYYAAYYSTKGSNRVKNYAGEDKVDYICQSLNDLGEKVIILSSAKMEERKFANRETIHLSDNTEVIYFSSLPNVNVFLHAIDVMWGYIQLIAFVIAHVKSNDTIIVYHSLGYRGIWGFLRKIKNFNYVLEVEELYQLFNASKSNYKKFEYNVFKYPDAFIFSNSIMEEEINIENKPFVIINGIYKRKELRNIGGILKGNYHDKIIVVYAGSLEKQKGVDYVIEAAPFLGTNYEIHIIGFGSEMDTKRINALIINSKKNGGRVSYDGVYKGDEYIEYLQRCDIGICIQDERDLFNKYEYPSKIFSYLSNGLQVVVNDLIQLRNSDVYPYLHISKSKKPQDIAIAIESCCKRDINASAIMDELDKRFKEELKLII